MKLTMKLIKTAAAAAISLVLLAGCNSEDNKPAQEPVAPVVKDTFRFATFNASFDRTAATALTEEMAAGDNQQIKNVAETLQRVRPDVVLLNEYDHDGIGADTQSLKDFQKNYLDNAQNSSAPISYPYTYIVPTNTGLLAQKDISGDGKITMPSDTYGFGLYHGQYGFVVLSKYPLEADKMRSFQKFLWKDMPGAVLPKNTDDSSYYSDEALSDFRLSSKNHIDIPVTIEGKTVHLLAMHPTPPVFDGPEDRNGRRNYDEIRLFSDYVSDDVTKSSYLIDDKGQAGGLAVDASFVIAGDLNADAVDGDSYQFAIRQLLSHSRVSTEAAVGNYVPQSKGGSAYQTDKAFYGTSANWTQLFPLRLDYVLPSSDLKVVDSGVYWEDKDSPQRYLFENKDGEQGKTVTSDHRLVWVDLKLK
jgi:endonuclease/exonuclease/phosphatase family metal-dependent hydrolase